MLADMYEHCASQSNVDGGQHLNDIDIESLFEPKLLHLLAALRHDCVAAARQDGQGMLSRGGGGGSGAGMCALLCVGCVSRN